MSSTSVATPSVAWHASTSALRRWASGPPACAKCPTSPLVSATSLTLWPCAANSAAVPPNFCSASSGCAPNAMIRSGRFPGICAAVGVIHTIAASSQTNEIEVDRTLANDLIPSFPELLPAHQLVGLGRIGELHLRCIPSQPLVGHAEGDAGERHCLRERRHVLEAASGRLRSISDGGDPFVVGGCRVDV